MLPRVRLKDEAAKAEADDSKLPQLLEQRTAFRHRVQKLRGLQAIYMPVALPLLLQNAAAHAEIEAIENILLGLPSEIAAADRVTACLADILSMEARLRDAQCRDSLQDLRNHLHARHRLYTIKKLHVRYQGPSTRARTEISTQDDRVQRAAAKYRRARRAKLALVGHGPWETEFRVLTDNDMRGVQDDDPDAVAGRARKRKNPGPAEGYKTISWIWKGADSDEAGYTDCLRREWLQLRARMKRWVEEKRLLPEEMRRILAFLGFAEEAWLARIGQRPTVDDTLQEGLTAYARKQAAIRRELRGSFRQVWLKLAKDAGVELGVEWDPVEGYVPRTIRRRVGNRVLVDDENAEILDGAQDLGVEDEEGTLAEYKHFVERDLANGDP